MLSLAFSCIWQRPTYAQSRGMGPGQLRVRSPASRTLGWVSVHRGALGAVCVWAQLLGQHLQGAVAVGRDQPKGATGGRVLSCEAGNLRNSLHPRELSGCCITIDPSLVPSALRCC